MSRKYADYEYKTNNGIVRVEKSIDENNKTVGWIWRFFHNSGSIISSNDLGEVYGLKSTAKTEGINYSNQS